MKKYYFFMGILIISIIGSIVYNSLPKENTIVIKKEANSKKNNDPSSVTCLINKDNMILDTWLPNDLVTIHNDLEGTYYLRQEAANHWHTMRQKALDEGVTIYVTSAYRTKEYQEQLYNSYLAKDPNNAPYYSAKPNSSEHVLGLAIDISYDNYLHHDLQNSMLGKWMASNSYKYGWIMRYPDHKTDITGYIFEPWHYRYVGKSLATFLQKQGQTLEEYYQ